jgi:hypothetical protein
MIDLWKNQIEDNNNNNGEGFEKEVGIIGIDYKLIPPRSYPPFIVKVTPNFEKL